MGKIEQAWLTNPSRRNALARMAALVAGSPIAAAMAQIDPRPLYEGSRALSLAEMQTAFDFEPLFYGNVPRAVYEYTAHGDGSEFNLRRNRQAFGWVDILASRTPVPASQVDLSSTVLGVNSKFPIWIAPTAQMVALHPDGETGMFRAATAASNTLMMLSINTGTPIGQVRPAVPEGTLWAQYYPQNDLAVTQRSIDTLQNAGGSGIIVTVDQQSSYYERTLHARNFGGRGAPVGGRGAAGGRGAIGGNDPGATGQVAPPAATPALTGAARYRIGTGRIWYNWQYIDAVRKMVKGPMLIKGIQHPQDALLSIEHGADAIIVSNHGGRSMDYGPAALEALPPIVDAVKGRIPILFDSGIRRGADCFKALALGADIVCLGRASRWGLAAFGIPGAQRVIEMLQQELVQAASAAGCARRSDINRSKVRVNFV
jgi:isopentenyl diphosphate isomerase/L-lactate dehydrogenase-like FMN-dependent dehydrogenase